MAEQKTCVICRASIPSNAKKCTKCGEYQSFWRRNTVFLASVAGAITLVTAGMSFILQTTPNVLKYYFPNTSVKIISYQDDRELILLNDGDGPVFLRDILISTIFNEGSRPAELTVTLSLYVEEGELFTHIFPTREQSISDFAGWRQVKDSDVSNDSEREMILSSVNQDDGCFRQFITDNQNAILRNATQYFNARNDSPMIIESEARLRFVSLAYSSEHSLNFPLTGLVLWSREENCFRP